MVAYIFVMTIVYLFTILQKHKMKNIVKMKNIILLALIFALFTQCTKKTEISQWRGPDRNGIYPETNLLKEWPENGPELIWKFDELGNGYSSATVLKDYVFTAGTIDSTSYIFKFDHTGNLIWKKELGPEWNKNFVGINSTPLIYDNLGYILGGLGDLFCFDIENGNIKWKRNLLTEFDGINTGYGITENLVIDEEKLFCTPGGKENNIIALNKNNGELIWNSKGNGERSKHCSPLIIQIGEEKQLINMTDSSVVSVKTDNGELVWNYKMKSGGTNIPIFKDGNLFIMAGTTVGSYKLEISNDGKSVKEVWQSMFINSGLGEALILNNKVYGSCNRKNHIYSLDWSTGEVLDSVKIGMIASIISADDNIYAYDFKGTVRLLKDDETGFNEVSSFKIKGGKENEHCSEPVIFDGRLYIRHDNSLFVYNIAKEVS